MTSRLRASPAAGLGLAFVVVVSLLAAAAGWITTIPWTGLQPEHVGEGVLLAGSVDPGSTADRLGVRPADRIVSVGEVRASSGPAPEELFLRRIANRYRAGDTSTWVVARGEETLSLTGPFELLPRALLVSHFLTYLPFLAIALFLGWLRRDDPQARLLVLTILAMVAGNFLRPITEMSLDGATGIVLQQACALGRFLGPALLVHWASGFPEPTLSPRAKRRVLGLAYGIPFLLFIVEEGFLIRGMLSADAPYLLYSGPVAQMGYFQLRFWVFVGSFLAAGVLLLRAFRRVGPKARRQLKWVVWSVCFVATVDVGLLAISFFVRGRYLDVELGPWRNVLYSATAIGLAIAVLKEDLFDIDGMIRKSTVYFLSAGAIFLLFTLLEELLQNMLSQMAPGGSNFMATVVAGTVAAAVFVPLRRRLDRALDQLTGVQSGAREAGTG